MFEKEAKKWVKEHTEIEYKASYGEFPNEPSAIKSFKAGAEHGYNKALKEIWHYPSKGEYPEKGKGILLYTKTLGLIFGEFCKGYNNLWTSNRCDFTTEEIIAWIEKEKILPKGE